MLPIANKPMLQYGLEHLKNAGIADIGIVLGPIKEGVRELIGDGSRFGLHVTYIDQPEPKGLAHAVMISKSFLGKESFIMYLGDNLLREGVSRFRNVFEKDKLDCVIGVTPVPNPSSFGVAQITNGKIVNLVEKPSKPKSNLALIGVYVFGPAVFDAVAKLKPSKRGEFEITDTISIMIRQGRKVRAETVEGWWKDTGKPEDLLEANQLVLSDLHSKVEGALSKETSISGNVIIESGSKTVGAVNIRGPVIIGKNCTLGPDVYLGPYTSIGDDCGLSQAEIENSIVMRGSRIECNKRIVDSLIGSFSTILNGDGAVPKGYRLIIGERSFAQL